VDDNNETRADMIRRRLELGGVIAVITGRQARIELEHPRIHKIDGDARLSPLPSNTRYVFFTRHTSHATGGEYIRACRRMGIPFSMEGTGEIKRTLCEIFGIPKSTEYLTESLPAPTLTELVKEIATQPVIVAPVAEEITMAKPNGERRGRVKNLVLAFPDKTAKELYEIANRDGIKTTLNSVKQAMLKYLPKKEKPVKAEPKVERKTRSKSDPDKELDKIAADAHAAIDLLLEYVKKYRKVTELLKELKDL